MTKTYAWIAAAAIILVSIFGLYGKRIADAYGEAYRVQLHLDETNAEIAALERRVKELESAKELDEQMIAELQARLPDARRGAK